MDSLQETLNSQVSSRSIVLSLLIIAPFVFLFRILGAHYDPREPPLIKPRVPYIGHIIGLLQQGPRYYQTVNTATNYPIYTLPMLNSRVYIVTSTALAGVVQRASKTLSFYSIALEVTKRLLALDEHTMEIIRHNINGEAPGGIIPDSHHILGTFLSPGDSLDGLTSIQLQQFSNQLNAVARGSGSRIRLHQWVKDVLTVSNAYTIYGPDNPFAVHPELVKAFWEYEEGMVSLLIDVYPSITAPKANAARKKINAGLIEFVREKRYLKASKMIRDHVQMGLDHGLSTEMTGHSELIVLFGILGNAVPTTFWLLVNIYSRPDLLRELRQEVEKAVIIEDENTRVIKVNTLKVSCPLLVSTFRETLRHSANLASVRYTLEDTLISEKYLLKKNSVILIASGVTHMDRSIWGEDVDVFKPDRFVDPEKHVALPFPKKVPSPAFRAFGGGSVICPGRHFALNETAGLTAAVILAFDILSEDGSTLLLPKKDDARVPLSVMKPVEDPHVQIRRRKGMENISWRLEL